MRNIFCNLFIADLYLDSCSDCNDTGGTSPVDWVCYEIWEINIYSRRAMQEEGLLSLDNKSVAPARCCLSMVGELRFISFQEYHPCLCICLLAHSELSIACCLLISIIINPRLILHWWDCKYKHVNISSPLLTRSSFLDLRFWLSDCKSRHFATKVVIRTRESGDEKKFKEVIFIHLKHKIS